MENQEMNNQEVAEDAGVSTTLTLDELSIAISHQVVKELDRANRKYPATFRSSNEALGTLRQEFLQVEEALRGVKVVDGQMLDKKTVDNCKHLEVELIQLGAMCIKAIYSCCELSPNVNDSLQALRRGQGQALI